MLNFIKNIPSFLGSWISPIANIGIKPISYFIDSNFRQKVTPVAGSVMYCDLYAAVEHSGIYVGDGLISNIVVKQLVTADSSVCLSDYRDFTLKSVYGEKIYVSCDKYGAVGNDLVAKEAHSRVGEKNFYGLVYNNCHHFSKRCLQASSYQPSFFQRLTNRFFSISSLGWELSFRGLKLEARHKIGATKWLLLDCSQNQSKEPEPDWQAQQDFFKQSALTPQFIEQLRLQSDDTLDYLDEIADEDIPKEVIIKVKQFANTLKEVSDKYDEVAEFLALCPNASFSYEQIKKLQQQTDFIALAKQLQHNPTIKELTKKMGRNYIHEDKKRKSKIAKASKSEIHGTHPSNDLMRLLPSELVNLEDENLEILFYAKLLEKNLNTYELSGITHITAEQVHKESKRTGPIIACLDTSQSMVGEPILKAKAILFAIANILKKEKRSLYVILFGQTGELTEYRLDDSQNVAGLLEFLGQGFYQGTDYQPPLQKALDIIQTHERYIKADILMLSDGDCQLLPDFAKQFHTQKQKLDCMVYSVLCDGERIKDNFSDEIIVL